MMMMGGIWLSSVLLSTLGANTRTHLVDALPELLEREGVTDDVLHGKLASGDHGDCLDMGTVMDDFLACFLHS